MMEVTIEERVPVLRFPEFEGEWEMKRLEEVTKINQGLQIAISERFTKKIKDSYFYITNEFLKEKSEIKYYILNPPNSVLCSKDDILMTRTGNTGQLVTGVAGAFHNNFFKIKHSKDIDKWFLYYFLNSYKIQGIILKLAGTSTIPDLNHGDFYKIKISFPDIIEQQKIAAFLTAVDAKLQQLARKKSLLEQYKEGIMHQIFSQKIRFKDDNGYEYPAWEETRLGKGLTESRIIGEKGNTARKITVKLWGKGVYKKNEAVEGSENTQYYYRASGQLIYSKLDFLNCAFGIIPDHLNGFQSTIDLPAFDIDRTVFQPEFLLARITQKDFYKQFSETADGSRKAKRIHPKDFLSFSIPLPSVSEQKKISDFLAIVDTKVEYVTKQIQSTQAYKKSLLTQLFV